LLRQPEKIKDSTMKQPIDNYWQLKLNAVKEALEKNRFEVFVADTAADAKDLALNRIIPALAVNTVSWGGSLSFVATGLFHALMDRKDLSIINTFDKTLSFEDMMERRRQSLLADLFITGTNALTEAGQLVNLDMIGNRVGAMMWGPKHVLLIIGRNKLCADLDDAMFRIKNYAAPVNTMNLDKKTPCAATGVCQDCASPERICNYWTIIEKSFVKHRIKIILVNEDLGF
jgi:L-lactate utilization protein LutB